MHSILVIDDEESSCRLFRAILEKAGYTIYTAANGLEGMKILKEHDPDLVITDIIMPVMEGVETIMKIRKEQPGKKIIAMTGHGRLGQVGLDIADKLGVDMSFSKPFSKEKILQMIEHVLGEK
ncbi:MAG: response regulator [Proteobacteria bacterium]|nr:response regulator [Pseudomonadota bacterium]